MLNEKVDVEVYGRRFTVEFEGITPLEVPALAKELTQKMERIAQDSGVVDTSKLAILAALECMVEITRLHIQQDNLRTAQDRALEQMVVSLNNSLSAAKEPSRK